MFKILSKESNIFSIPVYIGVLLLGVIAINFFNFNAINITSTLIAFFGVFLGYFAINPIGLNNNTHIPLFIYTVMNIALYPKMLDIGISWTILSNALFIWLLSNKVKNMYILVGALFALNYVFLPTIWPMLIFFILHILGTTKKIPLNIFRFFFGGFLVGIAYFSIAYFLGSNSWNTKYIPYFTIKYAGIENQLLYLTPIILLLIYAVFDYFMQYNKTSAESKFKYIFHLLFVLTQLIIIVLYMGNNRQYLLIITLPVSIIISRALYYIKSTKIQEMGIWVILLSLICYVFFQNVQF